MQVVGGSYARAQVSPKKLAGHLRPLQARQNGRSIPRNPAGELVSLADKLDRCAAASASGCPTGSRDPFALRRAAQGVVKILVEGNCGCRSGSNSAAT